MTSSLQIPSEVDAHKFFNAIKDGQYAEVCGMLEQYRDIANIRSEAHGDVTALRFAVYYKQSNIIGLLLDYGADINAGSGGGATVLMEAAMQKDPWGVNMMRALINRGADIDQQSNSGMTALMCAADSLDKLKLLVEKGANIDLAAKNGDKVDAFAVMGACPHALKWVRELRQNRELFAAQVTDKKHRADMQVLRQQHVRVKFRAGP